LQVLVVSIGRLVGRTCFPKTDVACSAEADLTEPFRSFLNRAMLVALKRQSWRSEVSDFERFGRTRSTSNKNQPLVELSLRQDQTTRQYKPTHNRARQDKARQDKTRQDKTRQDKTNLGNGGWGRGVQTIDSYCGRNRPQIPLLRL
jgi:hypothetical protein